MMKPFQAGHATESGVVAADFAAIGWTAAEQILEAQRGFFHAYGGTYDPAVIRRSAGQALDLPESRSLDQAVSLRFSDSSRA